MPETDPLIGQTLGPCRLDALIGRGGMGRVYKARHLALDRAVAVKLVDVPGALAQGATVAGMRQQILAEARAAARLEDPRIVQIYEVGEDQGIPYIVMQWVDGESLEARVKRHGALPPQEALEIIRETAAALAVAHKAGIVHRDIKPGNILVDSRGAVKLTDFGIARPAGVAGAAGEAVSGSFHFMAPEQAHSGAPDPRSDLYALGTTWYYALAAQPPYPGAAIDALARHRNEAPAEIRHLRPEVTEKAAALLRRLMAKKVEDRPADAPALLKEMLSVGMLLETDTSGSPFKILAAPAREDIPAAAPPPAVSAPVPDGGAGASPSPINRAAPLPPAPPAPSPAAELGSKKSFVMLLVGFGVLAFGWQWRRAGPQDWPAGAALLSLLPAALTWGDRKSPWRKVIAAVGAAAAVVCWGKHSLVNGAGSPSLEAMIFGGVGVSALFGSTLLGLWGQDRSEVVWSRALAPAASLGLMIAALTWTVPESSSWTSALSERASAWWAAFAGSGGGWRWLGTAGVGAALGAAVHLKVQETGAPKDRMLNWNK